MNSARNAAVEFISSLSEPSKYEFRFICLAAQSRNMQSAWDTIREIYRLAATGEWEPSSAEVNALVYAPLENPALIAHIESDMDRILSYHPAQSQLHSGWRYVQLFSCNPIWQQPIFVIYSD
jgi:hypothetical protein